MSKQRTTTTCRAVVLVLVLAASPLGAAELNWHTVDGGGGTSSSASYELKGTIGQPDAGFCSSGSYELGGGFWFPIPLGDCNGDGWTNLGDHGELAPCMAGPDVPYGDSDCNCYDFDGDGDADLADFAAFQAFFQS